MNFIILQQQLALQEVYQDTSSVVLYFQMQLQELPLKKYLNNIISYEYKNIKNKLTPKSDPSIAVDIPVQP